MTLTSTNTKTLTGREYLRVSRDDSGKMTSPAEQHRENADDAAEQNITLGEPYTEARAVSASAFSGRARDGFAALLADLEAGRFGADVLYVWENSRGSRRVGEWVTLIDLCQSAGVVIRVTSQGRTYDPRNGHDRKALIDDANDSEYESYKISTRNRRTARRLASEGRPVGVCPWGYLPVHDTLTGDLQTWKPDPDRAPLVAELFERLAAGHSLKGIARDWAERGVTTRSGRPFSAQYLRDLATRHAYAGLRNYRGGRKSEETRTVTSGEIITGTWEPLVAPELFWTVYRLVTDPSRRVARNGRAVHTLTRIIRCGVCGGPMTAEDMKRKGPKYVCRVTGCTSITRGVVDDVVIGAMKKYLAREDLHAELASAGEDTPEVAQVRADLAAARAELADAERTEPDTVAEARVFARLIDTLTGKVAELEDHERELTTPSALLRLIKPGADVAERWEAAPVSTKREVARVLLSPGFLGEVRINRRITRAAGTDGIAARIEWWHGDE